MTPAHGWHRTTLWSLALLLMACATEKPAQDAAVSTPCDCSQCPAPDMSCPEPPPPPEPQTIVTDAKGEGPVRTFFPGLAGRPSMAEDTRASLYEALRGAARRRRPKASPAPGTPGPPTMTVFKAASSDNRLPRTVPKGYKNRHDLRVEIEPYVSISPEGVATLRWQTWLNTEPSFVHFGLQVPDQILPYPRFRLASKDEIRKRSKLHETTLTLARLEKSLVDIADFSKGATVDYRIEMRDPISFLTLYVEGRFSYVRDPDGNYLASVTLTEGPFVDIPTTDGITVSFETDVNALGGVIAVGPDNTPHVAIGTTPGQRHEITLTGLQPDTLYTYHAAAIDARGVIGGAGDYAFRTAPVETRPFRFAVMSDSRSALGGGHHGVMGSNHKILRRFTSMAFRLGADLILFPGDLVNGYTTQPRWFEIQLESWKRAVEPVGHYIPIFEGIGNHEYLFEQKRGKPRVDMAPPNSTEDVFAREFVNPTNGPPPEAEGLPPYLENVYSFDYGKVHFVSVNTNYWISTQPGDLGNREGQLMEGQLRWLDNDLKQAREQGATMIFVYTHEPGYPNGGHVGDGMYWRNRIRSMNESRERFWQLMSDYKVDVVFHGDEHNYSRLLIDDKIKASYQHPVWQIITGGCGAPYYARDTSVPWAKRVVHFSPQEHFVMVDVLSDTRAVLTAFGLNGETLDRFVLERQP